MLGEQRNLITHESLSMSHTQVPKPHRPSHDLPAEREPPEPPVELDEGLTPPLIPDDPEHDRIIDPSGIRSQAEDARTVQPHKR
jgi:hypothetical protein